MFDMVIVVGCNHGIQQKDPDQVFGDSDAVTEQKRCFTNFLETTIERGKVDFIGEEWGLPTQAIARSLATERQIPWANINTSTDDLRTMGIPCDYVHGSYPVDDKGRWNAMREEFMLKKIRQERGEAKNVLIICGFCHQGPLKKLLEKTGEHPELVNYRTLGWYRRGLFTDDA